MGYHTLDVEERGGAVWLFLNRPHALNAFNAELVTELAQAIRAAAELAPVALVVSGRGSAFCSGGDLKTMKGATTNGLDEHFRATTLALGQVFDELERLSFPTIAAVNGVCVAGGFELLLAVDLAIAASSAKIGDGHANYGLLPGGGGTVRLPRLIGQRQAKRLLMLGEFLSAQEALAFGLVNWVVPDEALIARTDAIVASLAEKAPSALAKLKHVVALTASAPREMGKALEQTVFFDHLTTSSEVREGLTAFVERRKPNFRRLPAPPSNEQKTNQ